MSLETAIGAGLVVGLVYAIGERDAAFGLKVAFLTALAGFIGGNLR